jgi:hypothetical protein
MEENEDCLSPEEIEAATRKVVPNYYVCYDSNGNITSVTNTLPTDSYLQIPYAIFEKFVMGKELFSDWVINKTKTSANETGIELVPRSQQAITFRNNMLEWIRDEPTTDTEVFVHWDWFNKKWLFYISPDAKARVYNSEIGSKTLIFYISYEHNFEQLLRIIEISVYDLLRSNVEIPFIYDLESNIDGINLSTKCVFKSYGLTIWREIKE